MGAEERTNCIHSPRGGKTEAFDELEGTWNTYVTHISVMLFLVAIGCCRQLTTQLTLIRV